MIFTLSKSMFSYDRIQTDSALEQLIDRYQRSGRAIGVNFRKMIPCLATADRATHLIHPYPAKLLMHIPFFFLANSLLSRHGDVVADPFCGSGTVLLESQLAGRTALGADTNPLARLITKTKTSPLRPAILEEAVGRLFDRISEHPRGELPDVVNLRHWFYPSVTRQLQCLSEAIARTRDPDVQDFFRVCFSNCVNRVSLSDPRLAVPVKLRQGQYPVGHYLREKTDAHIRKLRRINVAKVFRDVVTTNCKRMSSFVSAFDRIPIAQIISTDARNLAMSKLNPLGRQNGTQAQLVITSPPYPGAQKYIRSCSLSLGWLGLCRSDELMNYKRDTIGREEFRRSEFTTLLRTGLPAADRILKTIHSTNPARATIAATYLCEMREALCEIWQLLNPGGHLVLVAANNQISGCTFRTQHFLKQLAEETGFTTILRLVDDIRSRGLMTKRNKTASVITREWVLVFAKGYRK